MNTEHTNKIGLIDSGCGGLSVLAKLRERMPHADVVYFGDTKNAPYGNRSVAELEELISRDIDVVRAHGASRVVSACNSISSLSKAHDRGMPFIDMTTGARNHMEPYRDRHVLVIATPATVASGLYQDTLEEMCDLAVLPIPDLAGAIEAGEDDTSIRQIVRAALAESSDMEFDALILGCTHYPLVRASIEDEARAFFPDITIIDPAEWVAESVATMWSIEGSGTTQFLISKESTVFRAFVVQLFPDEGDSVEIV